LHLAAHSFLRAFRNKNMGWLLFPAYLVPLLLASPWIATAVFYFAATLRLLGRVRWFGGRMLDDLPTSSQNNVRSVTIVGDRNYRIWCGVFAGISILLGLAYGLVPDSRRLLYAVTSACIGMVVAALYAPFYHDRSEITGYRANAWFRGLGVWTMWALYFDLAPVYMHTPPKGLSSRDETRVSLKRRHVSLSDITEELNIADLDALLAAKTEPQAFFTLDRKVYERETRHVSPPGRRPIIYAAHPHGLSTITAVFGAVFYGPEPMLPDASNVRVAVADIIFTIPIFREFALFGGCISAHPEAMQFNLRGGRDVFVLPGGMLEQAMATFGVLDIVWTRHGFCGMAYEHQASLVPIVAFGESDAYVTFNIAPSFRLRNYRRFGYAFPFAFIGPFPTHVTPVIGVPISATVTHLSDADRHRIERWMVRQKDTVHPPTTQEEEEEQENDSDGDTPLVDIGDVSKSLQFREHIDPTASRMDYYGTGYEREDEDLMRRSSWFIFRNDDTLDDKGFVTLMDRNLDNNNLLRSGHRLGLHRAFYAQWTDLYHCGSMALASLLGTDHAAAAETPGEVLCDLMKRLHRNNPPRQF
jgi:1-acyl-sn-glycerol-3-phosphate acyltransferase